MIKNVAILMAMQDEATPLINHLEMTEKFDYFADALPFRCFQKQVKNLTVTIVTSGVDAINRVDNIGCEAATLMAYESINKLSPDLIIRGKFVNSF